MGNSGLAVVLVVVVTWGMAAACWAGAIIRVAEDCPRAMELIKQGNQLFKADRARAAAQYREAIKLCPSSAAGSVNLALLHEKEGNYREAANAYRDALKVERQNAAAQNGLAWVLIEGGLDIKAGIEAAHQALSLKPDDPYAMDTLAWGYQKAGDREKAREWIKKASAKLPNDPYIRQHLAAIEAPRLPPHLVVTAQMRDDRRLLKAGEEGTLSVEVRNDGEGEALGVRVAIRGDTPILQFADATSRDLESIRPRQKGATTFTFRLPYSVPTGTGTLVVEVTESRPAYNAVPSRISIGTQAYPPPRLELTHRVDDDDVGWSRGNSNGRIEAGEKIELHVTAENRGEGTALDVKVCAETTVAEVAISYPCTELGDLPRGRSQTGTIAFAVGGTYLAEGARPKELALTLKVTEKTGLFGQQKRETLLVYPAGRIDLPPPPPLASDVDRFIHNASECAQPDSRKWAVVVGSERYLQPQIPRVPFARNDAHIVMEYLRKLLCVPEGQLIRLVDERATLTQLRLYLENRLPAWVKEGHTVFFYFVGHGIASNRDPYLIPYDGDPQAPQTSGYAVGALYSTLDRLKGAQVHAYLDACFSGGTRSGEALLPGGPHAAIMEVEDPVLRSPKLVALTAASGTQLSYSFQEQGHGLFTYYLLKGLMGEAAEPGRRRQVTVKALAEYVTAQVGDQARRLFGLESRQEPVLKPTPPGARGQWVLREMR